MKEARNLLRMTRIESLGCNFTKCKSTTKQISRGTAGAIIHIDRTKERKDVHESTTALALVMSRRS